MYIYIYIYILFLHSFIFMANRYLLTYLRTCSPFRTTCMRWVFFSYIIVFTVDVYNSNHNNENNKNNNGSNGARWQ